MLPCFLAHDVLWKSTATFVSDKNGIIDISQAPSCSGSDEDIATMGLFFNAKPLTNRKKKLPNSLSKIPLLDHFFCGNQNLYKVILSSQRELSQDIT